MSSLALMRALEGAPARYDAGMRLLTFGKNEEIHEAAAAAATAKTGAHVLEIGCGTGAVTAKLLARGAQVVALDQNPEMLEQARARLEQAPAGMLRLVERTASEIDRLQLADLDAVVAVFSLSEMPRAARLWVLERAARLLAHDGVVVLADEARPPTRATRLLHAALRLPQAALGWLVAGSLSGPIPDPAAELEEAGFSVVEERRWLAGRYVLLVARRRSAS
jgi:ubiquinone/menaquinone biosynthesis C-methylase UbiE